MPDMHLGRILARPPIIVAMFVTIIANGYFFASYELAPRIENVFSGPDPDTCRRAEQTHAPRAIALCCASESWPPRSICKGTPAERRREAADAKALELLRSRRERWELRGPAHYRYSFRIRCFVCRGYSGFTFTSEVIDGVAALAITGQGEPGCKPDLAGAARYATIEGVFDATEEAMRGSAYAGVTYNPRWSYPRELAWGIPFPLATDAMTTFEGIDFEVLP